MVMGKSGRKVATILYSKEFYDLETDYELVSGLRLWMKKKLPGIPWQLLLWVD